MSSNVSSSSKWVSLMLGIGVIVGATLSYTPGADAQATRARLSTSAPITVAGITSTGPITGASLAVTGGMSGSSATIGGPIVGTNITGSGTVQGASVVATSGVSGATLSVTGAAAVGSLTSSGAISGTTITSSGTVSGGALSTAGAISGASAAITGSISGGSMNSTGTFTSTIGTAAFVMATNARLTGDGSTGSTAALSFDGFKWIVNASEGLYIPNGIKLGVNGSRLTESVLVPSTSLDFGSIAAGGTATLTLDASQVTTNTPVSCSFPAGLEVGLLPFCWVTQANKVTFMLFNSTADAVDPVAGAYSARTLK